MDDRKVLLSVKDLEVKFRVRGRILTAIRGITLDIYENESIAIVGESGSGKSVFTKTFAGMLDSNGFIANGSVIFNDDQLAETNVTLGSVGRRLLADTEKKLLAAAPLTYGAQTWKQMAELEAEKKARGTLSDEESEKIEGEIHELNYQKTEAMNLRQTLDPKNEKDKIKEINEKIAGLETAVKKAEADKEALIKQHKDALAHDTAYQDSWNSKMAALKSRYAEETKKAPDDDLKALCTLLAKEIYLTVGRYVLSKRLQTIKKLVAICRDGMKMGADLHDPEVRAKLFEDAALHVRYIDEEGDTLHGRCILNVAKIKYAEDWSQIRGSRIATVFQDPMTSLNPIMTIGKQISSIIMKHQNVSEAEARSRAIIMMKKVGIPNAENRYDDYPFQYSGGMRQRIVIAIALSCQPKILICDEPTTALDVTIQAQILKLLKDLQRELNYTIVFITHDLGVVANVADRVGVLYAGQLIEIGTVEEVFYDPKHPYTWALLSSLPQLAERDTKLYSITGTPPSLYNKITGDAFAPRNPYCLKIDTLEEPPMFQVSETHFAKTWLLDPRAPKTEKPAIIRDIHGKLLKTYHLEEEDL